MNSRARNDEQQRAVERGRASASDALAEAIVSLRRIDERPLHGHVDADGVAERDLGRGAHVQPRAVGRDDIDERIAAAILDVVDPAAKACLRRPRPRRSGFPRAGSRRIPGRS